MLTIFFYKATIGQEIFASSNLVFEIFEEEFDLELYSNLSKGQMIVCNWSFDRIMQFSGYQMDSNVCSAHSGGKLIAFSILLIGYGAWGDLIYSAESRRNLGRLRYAGMFLKLSHEIYWGVIWYSQWFIYFTSMINKKLCCITSLGQFLYYLQMST